MDGRTVVITGGNAGIGQATATELARRGARVLITARDPADGDAAVAAIRAATGSEAVDHVHLDLASLASVRSDAAAIGNRLDALDVLVANAGVAVSERTTTADGFETMFGVNHLGHFLLVHELLPLIRAGDRARIVVVSSVAHRVARRGIRWDDLQSERSFRNLEAYGHSKLANILFTRELARRLSGTGVTANCLHPGVVRTRLGRDGDGGRLGELVGRVAGPFFLSPERGAATSVFVASDPSVEGVTGRYFVRCREATPSTAARDDVAARRLWEVSAALVGLA